MKDLFGDASYPASPGFKERGGTSEEAAQQMQPSAKTLRDAALNIIKWHPRTADEVAEALRVSILAIRPRLSELRAEGKIEDTGVRRRNSSGKRATVWATKGW